MTQSYARLRQEIDQLAKTAERLRRKEAPGVLARIKEAIEVYGFTASDLGFASATEESPKARRTRNPAPVKAARARSGSKVPVKYRDADGNAWSGRGLQPRWLKAALAAGHSIDEFRV